MTVINMPQKEDDSKEALKKVLSEIQEGERVFIIRLDDEDENYDVKINTSGFSSSDCIALLEVVKSILLEDMGF